MTIADERRPEIEPLGSREIEALDAIAAAWNAVAAVVRDGGDPNNVRNDCAELATHIHALQSAVLSNAAARDAARQVPATRGNALHLRPSVLAHPGGPTPRPLPAGSRTRRRLCLQEAAAGGTDVRLNLPAEGQGVRFWVDCDLGEHEMTGVFRNGRFEKDGGGWSKTPVRWEPLEQQTVTESAWTVKGHLPRKGHPRGTVRVIDSRTGDGWETDVQPDGSFSLVLPG